MLRYLTMGCQHDPDPKKAMRCAPRTGEVTNRCCGGRDLGPVSDAEAPSEEDMDRFGGVTRVCPECKTEVYDEAQLCHNCGHAFAGTGGDGLPTWAVVTMIGLVATAALGFLIM